jgi:uncharacterized RDD family membrane protein YckC
MAKGLDILTTQNVTIEYPIATVADRIFSCLLDLIFLFGMVISLNLLSLMLPQTQLFTWSIIAMMAIVVVFYSLFFEYFFNGQSWGKRIIGLRVVKINGSEAQASDYISRWAFRFIDIWFSFGTVAMFLINSTQRGQRIGDIVANTTVVKIKPVYNPSLSQIENIKSLENYVPVYTQVVQMHEEEMLNIKMIWQEVKKYPNKAHKEQLDQLRMYLCERLRIPDNDSSDDAFIQQIINDYIVLTR